MRQHLRTVGLGAALALSSLLAGGAATSLALFSHGASTTASLTTGTWSTATTSYLHNNPTPPSGNTAVQAGLPLSSTVPTATTLHNYDTDCDAAAGRQVTRGTGLAGEATLCRYASWRSVAYASSTPVSGTVTLALWARKSADGGNNPVAIAYLRDFNPGTGTYVEIGTASRTVATNQSAPFAQETFTWNAVSYSIPAGHSLELKVVATSTNRNVVLAYDTTAYPSALTIP